jgi:Mrp family chromosome partitioning ATPase
MCCRKPTRASPSRSSRWWSGRDHRRKAEINVVLLAMKSRGWCIRSFCHEPSSRPPWWLSPVCTLVAEVLAGDPLRSVCLVETNFRSPDLLSPWGEDGYGLAGALVRKGPIRSFARRVDAANNLWVLGCGTLVADCYNVFASGALRERVAELRKEFDFVIMHAASLTRYADAIGLGQLADGLILVIEAGVTRRDDTARMLVTLRASKIDVLAAVLNNGTSPIPEKLHKLL